MSRDYLLLILSSVMVAGVVIWQLTDEINYEENVNTLPYAAFNKVSDNLKGVQLFNEQKAFRGYSLYNPRNRTRAYLIDMQGQLLHQWQTPETIYGWHDISLLPDGSLLTLIKDKEVRLLDINSKTRWALKTRAHHEVHYDADSKRIYFLSREDRNVPFQKSQAPILDDRLAIVDTRGRVQKSISIYDMVKTWVPERYLKYSVDHFKKPEVIEQLKQRETGNKYEASTEADVMHTNSAYPLPEDIAGCCGVGDVILSVRNVNSVFIVNVARQKVVWNWGQGELSRQHHATYIGDGKILIFDNGVKKQKSRIVIVDISTRRIVWEYESSDFFSQLGGGCQYLPNGNVLIAESAEGRAFEVTPRGETVWNFYNPEFTDATNERAFLYRIYRIFDARYAPLVKRLRKSK